LPELLTDDDVLLLLFFFFVVVVILVFALILSVLCTEELDQLLVAVASFLDDGQQSQWAAKVHCHEVPLSDERIAELVDAAITVLPEHGFFIAVDLVLALDFRTRDEHLNVEPELVPDDSPFFKVLK
jgi:hypothetical protein